MQHLLSGPADSATPLDFSRVSFLDVSCADEMLNKLLLRLASGEIGHRYVYIAGANISVRETIAAVLHLRELAALYKNGDHVEVLGVIKTPMREVLEVLLAHKCATSAEISDALGKKHQHRLQSPQRPATPRVGVPPARWVGRRRRAAILLCLDCLSTP